MLWMLLSINNNALPEDFDRARKEIMQLWEKALKERNIPFTVPKKPKEGENPNYEQNACSANCSLGSCSISCYGTVVCGCTSSGEPVCQCEGSGYIGTGLNGLNINSREKHKSTSYFGRYTIYDISGRKVFEGKLNGKLPALKKGVYFLKGEDGKVRKVVVR